MKKAIIIFSGGLDSLCTTAYLMSKYQLYAITFAYGQRAKKEVNIAKCFAKTLKLKEHKITDIAFMKVLYENTNVLTSKKKRMPSKFDYSIVAPIRNAIFLTIASAWAFTKNASVVAYGAHTGDKNYPDCRPDFSRKLENALNKGEIDGIKSGKRKRIKIWSPAVDGLSKSEILKIGHNILGDDIFKTWSCYENGKVHCGKCESCRNRKKAFTVSHIKDKTKYRTN
ncbi:MAG: 7-cyano-7-deazaguanine synthase [Thaumarchaeota archaeon]|nr:7-cyano-7-deazaguanine synthase [Nitrososphaerota archaeon]GFN39650.1 MAG: queuosine Biosynthesis QueC ATPase [Marine Group I thaumarchaeote]